MTYSKYVTEEEKLPRKLVSGFSNIAVAIEEGQPFFLNMVEQALIKLQSLPTGALLLNAINNASPADKRYAGRGEVKRRYNVLIYRMANLYKENEYFGMDGAALAKHLIDNFDPSNKAGKDAIKYFEKQKTSKYAVNKHLVSTTQPIGGQKKGLRLGGSYAKGAHIPMQDGSRGGASPAAQDDKGVSALVGWNPNQISYTHKHGKNAGKKETVPHCVTLGHELIHALHALDGTNKSGRTILADGLKVREEEAYTVGLGVPYMYAKYTENKLRVELGMAIRESY